MKKLTHSQFAEMLIARKGTTFLRIIAETDTRAPKTGNPFDVIMKRTDAVVVTGAHYGLAVTREAARQGLDASTFKADRLPYGAYVEGGERRVIEHKGKRYLATQSTPNKRRVQPAKVLAYIAQGKELSREVVYPFLPESKGSAKQAAVGMGDNDSQVQFRSWGFDSIKRVRLAGVWYQLIPD